MNEFHKLGLTIVGIALALSIATALYTSYIVKPVMANVIVKYEITNN